MAIVGDLTTRNRKIVGDRCIDGQRLVRETAQHVPVWSETRLGYGIGKGPLFATQQTEQQVCWVTRSGQDLLRSLHW